MSSETFGLTQIDAEGLLFGASEARRIDDTSCEHRAENRRYAQLAATVQTASASGRLQR